MTPIQQLVAIAIPHLNKMPQLHRATLLEEAANILPEHLGEICRAQAVCLRHAEMYQMTLTGLLSSIEQEARK